MNKIESVIVVGASAAGVSCVRNLRSNGFLGSIKLIDKDQYGAYERPPLSKQVLIDKETTHQDIALITDSELDELNIEAYFGDGVKAFDPVTKTVVLNSNKTLTADAVVLATGGEARRLPVEGSDLPQVTVLRHFEDALKLRQILTDNVRVAVIGGGFIGAETTASLVKSGASVVWLDAANLPMAHLLPIEMCEKIVESHCNQGAKLIRNCRINKFEEQPDGSVSILFEDGSSIEVDVIVMGVGMSPCTPYLSETISSELLNPKTGGIQVNDRQETKFLGVYAAGDVAAVTQSDGSTVRHEHWQSAQHQGERVAATILNQELPDAPIEWFWSDQGDLHIEMAGKILPNKEYLVVRFEGDWPVYFSVVDNRVIGAVSVNNPNAVRAAMRMMKNNIKVDPLKLVDLNIPLRKQMRG